MSVINREELLSLVGTHGRPRLSLMLPTHRHAPGSAQDPIRFRNLVRKARGLLAAGSAEEELSSILSPVEALDEPAFWRGQLEGLAVNSAPGIFRRYSLPMPVPELCVVADSFHVRPLVRFLQANRRYFVLVLGQKGVRLWEGTSFGLGPVDVTGLPISLEDVLGEAAPGPGLQAHSSGDSSIYHGRGGPREGREQEVERFFRAVDRAVWPALRDERAPLVLAGPQQWLPLYRESGRYSFTLAEGVTGSFENASAESLHEAAWPVARAAFEEDERKLLADYDRAAGSSLATDVLTEVAKAAVRGRVRRLFVQKGHLLFGSLDQETGAVVLHGRQEGRDDDDVLDDVAEAVIARGGEVFEVAADRMPNGSAAAALLRW